MKLTHAASLAATFVALSLSLQATPASPAQAADPAQTRPNIVAVSYTHLDVYKRQVLMNAATPLIDHYVRPRIYGRTWRGQSRPVPERAKRRPVGSGEAE